MTRDEARVIFRQRIAEIRAEHNLPPQFDNATTDSRTAEGPTLLTFRPRVERSPTNARAIRLSFPIADRSDSTCNARFRCQGLTWTSMPTKTDDGESENDVAEMQPRRFSLISQNQHGIVKY